VWSVAHVAGAIGAALEAPPDVCAFARGRDVVVTVAVKAGADLARVATPPGRWLELLPRDFPGRLLERG
jgi:hypothetical protein